MQEPTPKPPVKGFKDCYDPNAKQLWIDVVKSHMKAELAYWPNDVSMRYDS
jgi:hypothetical protein